MRAIGLPKVDMVSQIGGISILLQGDEIQAHVKEKVNENRKLLSRH